MGIGLIVSIDFTEIIEISILIFLDWPLIYKIIVSFELLGIFLGLFLFFFSIFLILFYNVHYIVLLLIVELLLLGIFVYLFFNFFGAAGLYSCFLFILLMVCMGGFRISLLVSISRFFGGDFWFFKFIF